MKDLCVHDGGQIRRTAPDLERLTFQVEPVPPFRLDLTVQALRRRAINAVDRWDGTTYRRMLVVDQRPLGIEVVQIAPSECPMLQATVSGSSLTPCTRFVAMSALIRLLGVDRPLDDFYRAAEGDLALGRLAQLFHGLKPPRFATVFEALINAMACQQVTLSLGIQLLNRLAETCARSERSRRSGLRLPVAGRPRRAHAGRAARARLQPAEGAGDHHARARRRCRPGRSRRPRGPRRCGGGGAVMHLARCRPLDRRIRPAARSRAPARVSGRRHRRAQQPATLARDSGTPRLRRCATGPRPMAALPGPRLPAPAVVGPAARARQTHGENPPNSATGCCAERAIEKEFSP